MADLQGISIGLCPHAVGEHLVVDAEVRVASRVVRDLGLAPALGNRGDLFGLRIGAGIIFILSQFSKWTISIFINWRFS